MEHKKEEIKTHESECKKACKKQTMRGAEKCRATANKLKFIMLVIITISVVSIACMMHRHHEGMENHGYHQVPLMQF